MLFTSEQVSAGHPDKICDQISDIIVTDCLQHDPNSRVAVETMIKDDHVIVAGEISSMHTPDLQELVRRVLAAREPEIRNAFNLAVHISKQSGDIALGVDKKGAGDQGMMFGYACDETHRMLPLPFVLATEAIQYLQQERHPELLPDAKAQVTFDYRRHRIDTFLISTQHKEEVDIQVVQRICRSIRSASSIAMNFSISSSAPSIRLRIVGFRSSPICWAKSMALFFRLMSLLSVVA